MTCRVSIIIPVYNTEKYLHRCLDSVIAQTLRKIEIIVVNDASSDKSASILTEYEHKDSRITVITHDKNMGQGISRDSGITAARGEYLGFVDSDDWIELEMFEKMYKKAHELDADMVVCGIYHVFEHKFRTKKRKYLTYDVENIQRGKALIPYFFINFDDYLESETVPFVGLYECNKITRRKIVVENCLKHLPGRMLGEDAPFVLASLFHSRKVVCIPNILYNYFRSNPEAITASKNMSILLSGLKTRAFMRSFLVENNYFPPEIANRFYKFIIRELYCLIMNFIKSLPKKSALIIFMNIGNELENLNLEKIRNYRDKRSSVILDAIDNAKCGNVKAFNKNLTKIRMLRLKFKYISPKFALFLKKLFFLHKGA